MTHEGFHAKDGFYFRREDDGSVRVIAAESAHKDAPVAREVVLEPTAWASVVAAVSHRGESGETWREALRAHEGDEAVKPYEPASP